MKWWNIIGATLLLTAAILIAACSQPNPKDCPSLSGLTQDNCYLEAKNCTLITDSDVKDTCLVEEAKGAQDLAACDTVVSAASKGYCQEQIAVLKNDFNICGQIKDGYWGDNCYSILARGTNRSGLCGFVNHQGDREDCYYDLALALNDHKLCSKVPVNESQRCLYSIARSLQDEELCTLLEHPVNRASCILKVAKLRNDKLLCEKIKVNLIKEDCRKYFLNQTTNNDTGSGTEIKTEEKA
ncbi:MAG: hypothetical protein AABX04_04100 [Nanoarchaeota archaeon]